MNAKYLGLGAVGALALVLMLPLSVESRVKDTPHNLNTQGGITVPNGEVCLPCHAPHNTDVVVGYLWNHANTSATYQLHSGVTQGDVSHSSLMCLSCHDGTVALDSYGGATGTQFIGGSENLGTDLRNDHPIGVAYPADGGHGLNPTVDTTVPPDGIGDGETVVDAVETPPGQAAAIENGTVQCVSCHYAHGSRAPYGMFLRVDNTGSALCMTCHTR